MSSSLNSSSCSSSTLSSPLSTSTTTTTTTSSSVSENKSLVLKWMEEFWNRGNHNIVDEIAAEDLVWYYPLHGEYRSREAVKRRMSEFRKAFPDLTVNIVGNTIGEGDYVVVRWRATGTHTGEAIEDLPVGSLAPSTGKQFTVDATTVFCVKNGRIKEEKGLDDTLLALQKLDLIPPPSATRGVICNTGCTSLEVETEKTNEASREAIDRTRNLYSPDGRHLHESSLEVI